MDKRAIPTDVTKLLGLQYPIFAGPMFLVSDVELVTAVSNAGALGATPSLNWRTPELFREAVRAIKAQSSRPFGVNIIVNLANPRVAADLEVCASEKVPLVITSLGSPKTVIEKMHAVGCKVFCDVTNLEYAKKVESLGADGVIAVSAGAGGHAGPISPLVLIPYLKKNLKIPIVAAGGIATGEQIFAALALGASAVQIGTRFIATPEAKVTESYKKAILDSDPEDIVMTLKLSGTPASVINTPYIQRIGLGINPIEKLLLKNSHTKKAAKMLRAWLGTKLLDRAAASPTWKEVWSAGQGVGLIDDVKPAAQIVEQLVDEFWAAAKNSRF